MKRSVWYGAVAFLVMTQVALAQMCVFPGVPLEAGQYADRIELRWGYPCPWGTFTGWKVYRGVGTNGSLTLVATLADPETLTWTDTTVVSTSPLTRYVVAPYDATMGQDLHISTTVYVGVNP